MFFLHDAVRVDGKRVRNGFDVKHFGDGRSKTAIAILRPGHIVLGHEFLPFRLVRIQAHAEDDHRLTLKFFGHFADVRQRFAAGAAPRCPKIEQDHFPLQIVHGNMLAVERGDGEGRGQASAG